MGRYIQNNETRNFFFLKLSYTTQKSDFKRIKDFDVRLEIIKTLEENIGRKILDTACNDIFSNISPWARETQEKNKRMGLHQTTRFLHSKENHQQSEKTTQRMGDHSKGPE